MKIRVGYELIYDFPQSTPMIMVLGTHFTRASDVITPDHLTTSPSVPISPYRDILIGAAASSLLPAECAYRPMASFAIAVCLTWLFLRLSNTLWRICRRRPWSSCWAVATARPTACPRRPGARRPDGRAP